MSNLPGVVFSQTAAPAQENCLSEFWHSMTAPAWSALVATIALVVAICFQIADWRRDRFSRGVDAVRSLDTRFETSEFRELRKRAAAFLISRDGSDGVGREAIYGVLNFFETIGFLYAKKVVDAETVWHFFGTWFLPYFVAAKQIIEKDQKSDPTLYCELPPLYAAVCGVEAQKHPSRDTAHITSDAKVLEFLQEERELTLVPRPSSTPM